MTTLQPRGYLEGPYLSDEYTEAGINAIDGWQVQFVIQDKNKATGWQTLFLVAGEKDNGWQVQFQIQNKLYSSGWQFQAVHIKSLAWQFLATLYNTNNLRILSEFPSKGLSTTNWTASSQMPGDFSPNNVDTDVTEQVWRSNAGSVSGQSLTCDTGLSQGVFLDTLAVLNHNLSGSATVTLLGSNVSDFSVVGASLALQVTRQNLYYIAPEIPNNGFRYWRFVIDDSGNPDGYIQFGTVLFGTAHVFQGECFVDELDFELKDFTDTVNTEGFTNVANSRSQKRVVRLEFRLLKSAAGNFAILRDIFKTERTFLKCLWIPTPSPTDQNITDRFAVFGKLSAVPSERHKYLGGGGDADYASFTIEVDESR